MVKVKENGLERGETLPNGDTKSKEAKKYSKDFNGSMKGNEVIKLAGISKNSYYKYKRELLESIIEES